MNYNKYMYIFLNILGVGYLPPATFTPTAFPQIILAEEIFQF